MNLTEYAEEAANKIFMALHLTPTDDQKTHVIFAIEDVIVRAVHAAEREHKHAVAKSIGGDRETAKRVGAEIREASASLLANLESMR